MHCFAEKKAFPVGHFKVPTFHSSELVNHIAGLRAASAAAPAAAAATTCSMLQRQAYVRTVRYYTSY